MLPGWIERAEVKKDGRKQNQPGAIQKSYREIEIAVGAYGRVDMENKCGETQCGEVQHKRRTSALLEEYKETDEQIDQADSIDIEISRLPLVQRPEMIKIGPVCPAAVRRALHQIVKLASNVGLVEINLHVARISDFFSPFAIEAYSDQAIARE